MQINHVLKRVDNKATSSGIMQCYDIKLQKLLTEMLKLMYIHSIIEPYVAK